MGDPHPRRARWSLPALAAALLGGVLIGWSLRATPLVALITAATFTTVIIVTAEIVRRRINRDTHTGRHPPRQGNPH